MRGASRVARVVSAVDIEEMELMVGLAARTVCVIVDWHVAYVSLLLSCCCCCRCRCTTAHSPTDDKGTCLPQLSLACLVMRRWRSRSRSVLIPGHWYPYVKCFHALVLVLVFVSVLVLEHKVLRAGLHALGAGQFGTGQCRLSCLLVTQLACRCTSTTGGAGKTRRALWLPIGEAPVVLSPACAMGVAEWEVPL